MNRQKFISSLGLGIAAGTFLSTTNVLAAEETQAWWKNANLNFPNLPYGYDALEPIIDAKTVELHYSKHQRGYFDKFIAAIENTPYRNQHILKTFRQIKPTDTAIRNTGGGFYNHVVYWDSISPTKKAISAYMKDKIIAAFESEERFTKLFTEAALSVFGSGWAWLIINKQRKLEIITTQDQDNPIYSFMPTCGYPIFALDVWEHAYYLKYKNLRKDYVNLFVSQLDWEKGEAKFREAEAVWIDRLFD